MLADFESISQQPTGQSVKTGTNCFFLHNVTPRGNMTDFIELFYSNEGTPTAINGIEVELIYPGVDGEGIVYFGGGHTGVTFDISDGTAMITAMTTHITYPKAQQGSQGFKTYMR